MASNQTMGRKLKFPHRLTVPMTDELLQSVDAVLEVKENRVDMVREAVEREVIRRQGKPAPTASPAVIDEAYRLLSEHYSVLENSVDQLQNTLKVARENMSKNRSRLAVKRS